jgi:ribonuclease D
MEAHKPSAEQNGSTETGIAGEPVPFIDSADGLADLLGSVRAEHEGNGGGDEGGTAPLLCAVDTEADSLHSYREKLCLIQFASVSHIALIDPLKITDLSALGAFLDDADVWMHGADFDMLMLKRTFGRIPANVFDTQIAARLVGHEKFGLAALVESVFGVTLSKSSQRADWGRRPLTAKMLQYAVNDVKYILPLAHTLSAELRDLGRFGWFEESCRVSREEVAVRPEKSRDDVWRIAGWGKLRPRGLAFLRALWLWRDREAEILDRPAFKVTGNDVILGMAGELQEGSRVALPPRLRHDQRQRLLKAIEEARRIPEDDWPVRRRSKGVGPRLEDEAAFNALRARRDTIARSLKIDPTLIATRSALEILSVTPGAEDSSLLMDWQQNLLFPPGRQEHHRPEAAGGD